ncbi:hypothetical protein H2248_003103 [Termitomyces sp. 'cryptogamus']|nr:hypothetical protein H2248_003103 [Termitomyces sp. 'cryptogamus']
MLRPFFILTLSALTNGLPSIDRQSLVRRFNPTRNGSSLSATTPMQVGNGNFAFGVDVTGLQTLLPFATMSSWGWKNDTLPAGMTIQDVEDYKGVSWYNHGRLVQYDFGGGGVEQWLISNPNRVNLGRIGLVLYSVEGEKLSITGDDLTNVEQELDLWTGKLASRFSFQGETITVETAVADDTGCIGIVIGSSLLKSGRLGVFLDFPWSDGEAKFSAPFVGNWNATSNHTTMLEASGNSRASIFHTMVAATFKTTVMGEKFGISRDSPDVHRYTVQPSKTTTTFSITVEYGLPEDEPKVSSAQNVIDNSASAWEEYWTNSGFVDVLTGSTDSRAAELQRRIILSRYLMKVNEAGDTPPQESGLVNDGWYGKFHMEMYFWHCAHWALWNNWDLLRRSTTIYSRFLDSSIARAQVQQGWPAGARWPKMTDPSGRSSPGEINNLLIWQQPHPLIFALYEYRAFPVKEVLEKWRDVVIETANWMSAFAWYNETTGVYDIGPPMYITSEDTSPNVTQNPAVELAYWRLGLDIASKWMINLGEEVPDDWTKVAGNLAKLPIDNGTYAVYEGIESDFWTDKAYTNDHPTLVGLHGWLPPTSGLNVTIAQITAEKVWVYWNVSNFWGWDFPMLAMSAARNGDQEKAVEWLLHPLFAFDDVGMPIGGARVPTPYFPGSGALLLAIAMMAEGWDGSQGSAPGFPSNGWDVRAEGLNRAL